MKHFESQQTTEKLKSIVRLTRLLSWLLSTLFIIRLSLSTIQLHKHAFVMASGAKYFISLVSKGGCAHGWSEKRPDNSSRQLCSVSAPQPVSAVLPPSGETRHSKRAFFSGFFFCTLSTESGTNSCQCAPWLIYFIIHQWYKYLRTSRRPHPNRTWLDEGVCQFMDPDEMRIKVFFFFKDRENSAQRKCHPFKWNRK